MGMSRLFGMIFELRMWTKGELRIIGELGIRIGMRMMLPRYRSIHGVNRSNGRIPYGRMRGMWIVNRFADIIP